MASMMMGRVGRKFLVLLVALAGCAMEHPAPRGEWAADAAVPEAASECLTAVGACGDRECRHLPCFDPADIDEAFWPGASCHLGVGDDGEYCVFVEGGHGM